MSRIDKAISDASGVICDNIARFDSTERGLLSQNILGHIRNFVECVAIKASLNGNDDDPHDYGLIKAALKEVQRHGELHFLYKFHELLQKSVSHYTIDKDGSERLMIKYYEHLLKIKVYLKEKYKIDVLENIDKFPLNIDTELLNYYMKIAERIESPSEFKNTITYDDRYYIQKIKPFFIKHKIYYEVTFTAATNNTSKFDRMIAFTRHEIMDNYAVKFSIRSDKIRILGKDMSILIIDAYDVSIRRCELQNFSKILGIRTEYSTSSIEYKELMRFLSTSKMSLTELVSTDKDIYDSIKRSIITQSKSVKIYKILDQCREIILKGKDGSNVLRYLLYKMNNRVIKWQYNRQQCDKLSSLYLNYGCIPFDSMPYCTSLIQHNPRIYDLFDSIPISDHEHELFARYIKNNTEIDGHLFTARKEIKTFENIDRLIRKYNNSLYYKHDERRLEEYKGYIYIKGYVEDSAKIISKKTTATFFFWRCSIHNIY